MKKYRIKCIALALAAVLLTGCGDAQSFFQEVENAAADVSYVAYEDMEYTRPDMTTEERLLADACEAAAGEDLDRIIDYIYAYYDVYDDFYTNYSLADIRYCADLTDIYWEDEYSFCAENAATLEAGLEELYYALAKSPCREELEGDAYFGADFFDSYEGENQWDEQFTELLRQEGELQSRYYELSTKAVDYEYGTDAYYDACGEEMAELLAQLIGLRQQIAAYWGYDDYVEFATDFYYYRDYSTDQWGNYLQQIRQELVPLYREVITSPRWEAGYGYCSEQETYEYVRSVAKRMSGMVWSAFALMDQAGLYDISYGENKYDSSFETYLTSYEEPFVFLNPEMVVMDKLAFAHEFGHFCNDYASYGSYAGTDVMEVFSQGMEYLSLCYAGDSEEMTWLKMADSLCLYVEQAAFACFEERMYGLTGEALTADNLRALYAQVAQEYGIDSEEFDDREFVTITHFYTNPMYIISYVVSNDAALQLYQMELEEEGAGLACFEENLTTQCYYFLEFLDEAGLESPFAGGRLEKVRQTFEEVLR